MGIECTFVAYHCTSTWELSTIGDESLNVDDAISFPGFSPTCPMKRERETLENAGHVAPEQNYF